MWQLNESKGRFFNAAQRHAVDALFEAILPGSPTNPGASDVGAGEYLDRLLARDDATYYELRQWRPQYVAGLAMLDAAAISRFGKTLTSLTGTDVTTLLAGLQAGTLSGFPDTAWQKAFFGVLRSHCIEGCFADKRWGGNRNNIMWQWYGYPTGPSADFARDASGVSLLPRNRAPDKAATPSANTATAAKDPGEIQSATVLPDDLKRAIKISGAHATRG